MRSFIIEPNNSVDVEQSDYIHMDMDLNSHSTLSSLPLCPCVQEGHCNKVSSSRTVMVLGRCRQNFVKCESLSGKQSIRACTWRDEGNVNSKW